MARRRPGQSAITSPRDEKDEVLFLSGIFEGKTLGTPIAFMVKNNDQRSQDYQHLADVFRPSHADFTWQAKHGFRDVRGGGRSSARETIARVVAGSLAKQLLAQQHQIIFSTYVSAVGKIDRIPCNFYDLEAIEANVVRCPIKSVAEEMRHLIAQAKQEGDSVGGQITCVVRNVPAGWGEPVFDKLSALFAHAMMSINAVKGFEIGSGFDGTRMKGSEHNDAFIKNETRITTISNHSGGIQGGISNGNDIMMHIAFKPVSTIAKIQKTINAHGEEVNLDAKGRHDPCVLPRAVAIVEAMAALVLADAYLIQKSYQ
jgi:chorismate synthase